MTRGLYASKMVQRDEREPVTQMNTLQLIRLLN